MNASFPPYPGYSFGIPTTSGPLHIGPDGRAENTTTNPYTNALFHNGHQIEDMVYAIGAQESLMGASAAGINPNLAWAQQNIAPAMSNAYNAFSSAMGQPQSGTQGNPGHAADGGQAPGTSNGNTMLQDVGGYAALGGLAGAGLIGLGLLFPPLGIALGTASAIGWGVGLGATAGAAKHWLMG
jgi:hypothetical protein